jgi:hypothetical protein
MPTALLALALPDADPDLGFALGAALGLPLVFLFGWLVSRRKRPES